MMLLGFSYPASSTPSIVSAGVGVGVGLMSAMLLNSMASNPLMSNNLVSWAFIGFSSVEVSGSIGLVYSFLSLYASILYFGSSLAQFIGFLALHCLFYLVLFFS